MRITFARLGVLAVATALLSLAPLLGRTQRRTTNGEFLDPESGEGVSFDSLVFVDQWLARCGPTRRELG